MKHYCKKSNVITAAIMAFVLCSRIAVAGSGDTLPHRYFSFGMRTSKELISEFSNPVLPSFIMSVDLIKNLRAEFQIGRRKTITEAHYTGWNAVSGNTFVSTFNPESKASHISAGLFGMHRVDKTRFYAGYRFGMIRSSSEYVGSGSSSNPALYSSTTSGSMHSLVIGGEYFPVSRFSLGAEAGLHRSKSTTDDTHPSQRSTAQEFSYIDAAVVFRFYPF